nr:MAG TPA: hypothetical protein [Caudoviricetes sp.]
MFSQINCKLTIIHTFHLPSASVYRRRETSTRRYTL